MLLLLFTSPVVASDLGRLVVLSVIGEPLRAEIDVLSFGDESAPPVPGLASPDAYPLAGFRYNAVFNGTSVQLRQRPGGRRVIEVLSILPVNEPVVRLLIQLESPHARVIRGYTVLLDLPGHRRAWNMPPPVFLPAVVLPRTAAAAPSVQPVQPRLVRVPAKAAVPVVSGDPAEIERKLRSLEIQVSAGTKALAVMLDQIAELERVVKEVQRRLDASAPGGAASLPAMETTAVHPPVAAPVTTPATATPPISAAPAADDTSQVKVPASRDHAAGKVEAVKSGTAKLDPPPLRARTWMESILDEALLIFGGCLLLVFAWLAYQVWGRRASAGIKSPSPMPAD